MSSNTSAEPAFLKAGPQLRKEKEELFSKTTDLPYDPIEIEKPYTEKSCSFYGILIFVLGLVSGTFSAVLCKVAYDTTSVTLDGSTELFQKPICLLLLMFTGMVPAIFIWLVGQSMLDPADRETISTKSMAILVIPCLCDLFCTLLLLIAQVYITASMWQMLRGSVIVITALLKRFTLNHHLRMHMWLGILTIAVAMLIVASVSLFETTASDDATTVSSNARLGITLVLVGCLAQGVQYVFEEKVMSGSESVPPLVVIGFEGLWGTFLTLVVIYPLAYYIPGDDMGSYENPWNSLHMITSSPVLAAVLVGFVATVTCYNCAVIYVTKYLSAIWHAILDNFRPISIWMLDLSLFYYFLPNTAYGEQWMNPGSWVQMGGLAILLFGTAVYNGSVVDCSDGYELVDGDSVSPAATEPAMSSPNLSRSPFLRERQKDDLIVPNKNSYAKKFSQDV